MLAFTHQRGAVHGLRLEMSLHALKCDHQVFSDNMKDATVLLGREDHLVFSMSHKEMGQSLDIVLERQGWVK